MIKEIVTAIVVKVSQSELNIIHVYFEILKEITICFKCSIFLCLISYNRKDKKIENDLILTSW